MPPLEPPADAPWGPSDREFKGHDGRGGGGGFGVRGKGGRLHLCPTGDCKASIIDLTMHHLLEVDADGKPTKNRVGEFGSSTYNWTEPATSLTKDGVNISTRNQLRFCKAFVLEENQQGKFLLKC